MMHIHTFVCIEAVNAFNDMIKLAPGEITRNFCNYWFGRVGDNPEFAQC